MTVMAASEPEIHADGAMQKLSRIKAIGAASSGNLVEWYDFYAYAFTSIYFAAAFFPSGDQTSQLLATAGIFAVGFFMRPLGGWLFGWIADAHGRKNSMVLSVLLMCAGSLMIGISPPTRRLARRRRRCCSLREWRRACRLAASMERLQPI